MVYYIIFLAFATYHVNAEPTATCRLGQWTCQDKARTCIPLDGKCDGVVDCPDGSDETHAVCRTVRCPPYLFHCTYGACVDGDARCNGRKECQDNSDEIQCGVAQRESDGSIFQCDNGDKIPSYDRCDGKEDCKDGTDEGLATCAGRRCAANLFQCANGACVDENAACDPYGTLHCTDGSDEAKELCENEDNRPSRACILPEYPANGKYEVISYVPTKKTEPGQRLKTANLKVTCVTPNDTNFLHYPTCTDGWWKDKMIKCSFCKVPIYEGVKNECKGVFRLRECHDYELNGTKLYPTCTEGYSKQDIGSMECVDGKWNREIKCKKADTCGWVQDADAMIVGGAKAKKNEVPWHAGIYDKSRGQYEQICGGSLVSQQLVISAAHCFWNDREKQLPSTNYAVALGELKKKWNSDGQYFNVSSIKLHPMFRGDMSSYRADMALVFLDKPAMYDANVKPVCLDSYQNQILLDNGHTLSEGKIGKVAGWGLTSENGTLTDYLKVNEIQVVSNLKCINDSIGDFVRYISDEVLCAGNLTDAGTALCDGDSGGGLVFREGVGKPYYLRGIASLSYRNEHACNIRSYSLFTNVVHYADFIRNHTNTILTL